MGPWAARHELPRQGHGQGPGKQEDTGQKPEKERLACEAILTTGGAPPGRLPAAGP